MAPASPSGPKRKRRVRTQGAVVRSTGQGKARGAAGPRSLDPPPCKTSALLPGDTGLDAGLRPDPHPLPGGGPGGTRPPHLASAATARHPLRPLCRRHGRLRRGAAGPAGVARLRGPGQRPPRRPLPPGQARRRDAARPHGGAAAPPAGRARGPRGGPLVPAPGWGPPARRPQGPEAGGGSFHTHTRTHARMHAACTCLVYAFPDGPQRRAPSGLRCLPLQTGKLRPRELGILTH